MALALTLVLAGCQKPVEKATKVAAAENKAVGEKCDAPDDGSWLPKTKVPSSAAIDDEAPDCEFYKISYQNFLFALENGANGRPAFLDYPTIETLFDPAAAAAGPVKLLAGVHQAGPRQGVLADANGNPVYYSIHVNPAFREFVVTKLKLTKATDIHGVLPDTVFPAGVAEYKAAWQVVKDPAKLPADAITIEALVPTLSVAGGKVVEDLKDLRPVTVALIAFHVAFTLNNHREMIWASFEQAGDPQPGSEAAKNGKTDRVSRLGPIAKQLPGTTPPEVFDGGVDYLLFPANAPVAMIISPSKPADFDPASQTFKHPTPVYRAYPGSRVDDTAEDGAVVALNRSALERFTGKAATDKRIHYRLVGAIWLKHPQDSFKLDADLRNPTPTTPTDVSDSILSGESGMSSLAMESFTQTTEPHCFRCHNTKLIENDATGDQIIAKKLLNVSHVFSRALTPAP